MHSKSRAKFSQYAADCLTTPERLQDRISIFGHLTTVFNPLPAKRVLRAVPVRKPDKDLDANTDAQGSHLQHCRKPPALRGRNINHGGTTDLYWQSGLRQDLFMEIASAGAMLRSPSARQRDGAFGRQSAPPYASLKL
jgi:hypothetical protein